MTQYNSAFRHELIRPIIVHSSNHKSIAVINSDTRNIVVVVINIA